jgi:glycosyltransferase involved in cell wall biosynthesis
MIKPRQPPSVAASNLGPVSGGPFTHSRAVAYPAPHLERERPSIIHLTLDRLPPVNLEREAEISGASLPVKIGFVLITFSFGGSETETIELVEGADPELIRFTGIAVAHPLPLPDGEPAKDGRFPPILMPPNPYVDGSDPRVRLVRDFQEAVEWLARRSDIIISWGLANLATYLPAGKRPKIVILSKDSGDWARNFLRPNSLATPYCVANSTVAAAAYPPAVHNRVKVIHDGINPRRVAPKISRAEQRRRWDLVPEDKVVGYLGRIEHNKGVSKTVEGLARLPAEWKAVFVGVNPNSSYTEELARHCEERIPGRYRLIGWCHDIGSALAALDVFCQPSEHEGFSNSLGEAWLAGVPTIYTEGTGAVPDLGNLGIPVSPDANGSEMADAIVRALGNREGVERAHAVMYSAYLTQHYVARWTDYLLGVHHQRDKCRVLLLIPGEMTHQLERWFETFQYYSDSLDICCITISGGRRPFDEVALYERYGCPTFYVSASEALGELITYTRPDAILTFPSCSSEQLLPAKSLPPVLVTAPGAISERSSWATWLQYLYLKGR